MSVAALVLGLILGAPDFGATFDRANRAYEGGESEEAIRLYEQLVAYHISDAAVFCNLGSAYYRAGRLGPAIANYERAVQLEPGARAARHNLAFAVGQTKRRLLRPPPPVWEQVLLFWHYRLTPFATRTFAILTWLLCWGVLALHAWRPYRLLRSVALAVGIVAVAMACSAWVKAHPAARAVAARARVPLYRGASNAESLGMELYEGDRVTIERRMSGWAHVATVDGERGWAPASALIFVGPPYERSARNGWRDVQAEELE